MSLVRQAIVTNGLPVSMAALERAAQEGRRAYARQLFAAHLPIIDRVRRTGTFERTQENDYLIRDLLDSRAILHYVDDQEWYAVNPLIPEASQSAV
jgi:hypothetical protein